MKAKRSDRRRRIGTGFACLLIWLAASPAAPAPGQEETAPQVQAPGWSNLEFEAPPAGTYELPILGPAGDGAVLDSHAGATTLHRLMGDGIVVLSLIYSSCSDANGCPLATHVLAKLKSRLSEDSGGTEGIRFISLSFDPVQDTPEVMRRYGAPFVDDTLDWRFLTARDQADLQPILERYGQAVVRDPGAAEGEAGSISHVLRVFLVDPQFRIRNIYSASFLHADTLFNDIRTLQDEARQAAVAPNPSIGPGDVRDGYEDAAYRSRSQTLESRRGRDAPLTGYLAAAPLGLPPIPVPADNPITEEKVQLGRRLFFDRRLSHNDTFSCAMCHVPEQGFTSNELATAVGIEGRTVRRNSPTIYNVAYLEKLFHDGRESSLEQQIWGPLLAHNEMGNPSVGRVLDKIRSIPEYASRFDQAFEGRGLSMETIGMALASYERLLVSADSPFDRWYYGHDDQALDGPERAGFELFRGKAGCSSCHLVGPDAALFTDNRMHNTGAGYRRSMSKPPRQSRMQVAPGEFVTVAREVIEEATEPTPGDLGLYEITGRPEDRWKYRTPSLRNVALTAPYLHDGSLPTLEDVIDFYDAGGVDNPLRDPLIRPLGLTTAERDQLVAFLRSLTGSNVAHLVSDAFAVPVGNPGSEVTEGLE